MEPQNDSVKEDVVVEEDLVVSEYLKCSICFQGIPTCKCEYLKTVFTYPLITPCQHTFCKVFRSDIPIGKY
jgi:hypothetical protein